MIRLLALHILLIMWSQSSFAGKKLNVVIVKVNQYRSTNTACSFRAYVESHNASRDWNVSYVDFPIDEVEAVNTAKKLMKNTKPDIIVGDISSQHALVLSRVFNTEKTPYLITSSSLTAITEGRPFVIRYTGDTNFYASQFAKFATRYLKTKSIAIVVDLSKPFSTSYSILFKQFFEKETPDATVVTYELIAADTAIKGIVDKVIQQKPDLIYAPVYGFEGIQIINLLESKKSTIPLVLHSATMGSILPPQKSFPIYFNGGTDPLVEPKIFSEYTKEIARYCKGPERISTNDNMMASCAWDAIGLLHNVTKERPSLRGMDLVNALDERTHRGIAGLRVVGKDRTVSLSTYFYERRDGLSKYVVSYGD